MKKSLTSRCTLWAVVIPLALLASLPANAVTTLEFMIPTPASFPYGITAGPDGNIWFTESAGNKIGRITTTGSFTEFTIPTTVSQPRDITAGPDGNIWFTELAGNKIGRITTTGSFIESTIPTALSSPDGITGGPDGNVWFTESGSGSNKIGRITPAGVITEFPTPTTPSQPSGIAAGSDGNLWFVEGYSDKIGLITPGGIITEFQVLTSVTPYYLGPRIAAGSDGNLWVTESNINKIGKVIVNAGPTPLPTSQQVFPAFQVFSPVVSSVPSQAEPIGIGSLALAAGSGTLSISIALGQFSGPVDVYFLLFVPSIDPINIYQYTSLGTFQALSAGLSPWVSNLTSQVSKGLFGDIPTTDLPRGAYVLGVLATGAGDHSLNKYYCWITLFTL